MRRWTAVGGAVVLVVAAVAVLATALPRGDAGEGAMSRGEKTPAGAAGGAPAGREAITLGGGCFWCLEAVFDRLQGVESVRSGYAGGRTPNPTYEQVCSGETGHAEVVQVLFDPQVIPLREVLQVFFTIHDPTTLNRQGADVGTQYRSAIFYSSPEQKEAAEEVVREIAAAGIWDDPIVTQRAPLDVFYPAEDYHQEYYDRNPNQGYCAVVIAPKVAKFREKFSHRLK